MNMHLVDWLIVLGLLVFITGCAWYTKRYTQSVADFLAANRCAGRYLLAISEGIAGVCAISVVAWFEMYYAAGFTAAWWELMMTPLTLLLALSGWVVYRFRQTRAMTLAQFFEVRYSKKFRVFAGIILWVSGIINFGIFPAVGARFFIYFCGLPETIPFLGVSTFAVVMIFLLVMALLLVFLGGQISVMITDFFQGMFVNAVLLIILAGIFWEFDWSTIVDTLKQAPADASRLNPYHTDKMEGFNAWYFIIQIVTIAYGWRAWQGSQAYNCSAKSAHEAKMAGMIGQWRGLILVMVVLLLPIGAYVVMHNPDYLHIQTQVNQQLERIDNPTIRTQMTVPLVLSHSFPPGIVGLLCAVMLAAFISTHDTYLHSWGSIFVQDVILPFRKKPFTPRQHLLLLRLSILFVAVFIFLWSLLFRQTEYIRMFFAITGAIWLGGAGAVIVGGLYWKRGSTGGAFAALGVGAVIAVGGIVVQQLWRPLLYPWMAAEAPCLIDGLKYVFEGISRHVWGINWKVTPEAFPLDGQWVNMVAIACAVVAYLAVSLVSWKMLKRPAFEMDRLLHRGKYAVKGDQAADAAVPGARKASAPPVTGWRAIFPSKEFSLGDKCIYFGNLTWTTFWFSIFVIATVYNLRHDVSDDAWAAFWWAYVIFTVVLGVGTTIWFLIGGLYDIRTLFRTLATLKRDHSDDGRVVNHHNVADEPVDSA